MDDGRLAVAYAEAAFLAAFFFLLRVAASFAASARFSKRFFDFAVIAGTSIFIPVKRIVFSYSSDILHKGKGEPKYASAHDLRRSCGERMATAGVPEREIAKVLRHADIATTRRYYAPGTVQESAGIIREKLTVPRNSQSTELT